MCQDIISELNGLGKMHGVNAPIRVDNIRRHLGREGNERNITPDPDPEDEPVEDGREEIDEDDNERGEGEEEEYDMNENDQIKAILTNLENRAREAEDERDNALEENHQLKLRLKDVLQMNPEVAKHNSNAIQGQIETLLKKATLLEKDNMKLRTELKTNLEEKLQLIQKIQKYDGLVEELKNYNSQLIDALKESEEQIKLIKEQKSFSQDEMDKIRSDIESYQKKFEEIEEINNELDGERVKNQEASVKYQDILKENELLKDKLTSMGKEMDKIKSSVSMAFEEEEQTKVKIRELITAMHGQLQQAQQRILEKEEENLKLLMIIKQFKEGRSFEVGKTQSVGVPRIIRDSNSDSQQKVSNSYRNHISGGEDRDEEDENENEDDYNNAEMDEGDSAHIDNQIVPQRRSLQPERKKKSSNLKASHEEDIFSKPASQGPTKSAAGGIKKNPSKQKVDVLKSNLLQDQFQTYASQKSKDTKEKEGKKPPIITDKTEIANKFLSTIKRSKQKINKIESDQGIPQPPPQRRAKGSSVNQQNDESAKDVRQQKRSKSRKPKRDDEGKQNPGAGLSDNERHMMQAKVDMISQMNAVLSEFELRIHQMKSDMSNLIGK